MFKNSPIFDSGFIEVDETHKIYYEQFGDINGLPIIFLHGGPGSGFSNLHQKFFDKKKHRVIFFDQRGSGKSQPYSEIFDNNTEKLVNDIEIIRKKFKIHEWLIFGGSWGSTLGLVYGIKYPQYCKAFILRGIFLGTLAEVNWFLYDVKKFFPEAYENFISIVPKEERTNILNWYYKKLHSKEKKTALEAAKFWNQLESSCSTLKYVNRKGVGFDTLAIAKIESHYFVNNCFLKKDYIIKNVNKIDHKPGIIIQGRHDVICPPNNAFLLHKNWSNSKLEIIEDAGHSAFEQNTFNKIVEAVNIYTD